MERRLADSLLYAWTNSHDEEDWITPLVDSVDNVTCQEAVFKPSPGAASIWELMSHAVPYTDALAAVLSGAAPAEHPDWPERQADPESWSDLVARLKSASESIKVYLATVSDESLLEVPEGRSKPRYRSVQDIVIHDAYHAGQVVKLLQIQRGAASAG